MKYLSKLALGTLLLAVASVSFGQVLVAPADAIQQEEMGNLNSTVGDSFIHMFNAATNGGTDGNGSIVAQVYVFDALDEQLVACCSCPLTPDQGATLSAKKQLIKNTLTGVLPSSITVKLVGTKGGNAATDQTASSAPGFSSGLRADRTTTHLTADYPGVYNNITEADFKYETISQQEYETRMVGFCSAIFANGSNHGICVGCTKGVTGGVAHD
jgi:hypothetical protein